MKHPALAYLCAALALSAIPQPSHGASAATVIALTQIPCQFLESENGIDRGFRSNKKTDCEAINSATGQSRLTEAQVLRLKPGHYVFHVTNQSVPYEVGFWLRESDYQAGNPWHKLTKTSVSGGGLLPGKAKDYEVDLKAGEYLYSCPLNPTPDYRLVVSE